MKRLTTLADISDLYLNTAYVGTKTATLRNALAYMEAFVLFIGTRLFIEKGRGSNELYAAWYAECHRRWSYGTATLAASVTSRFMNWLFRNEYISNNPHQAIQKVKCKRNKPRAPFTQEEYEKLKEVSKGDIMHWAIICGSATGMSIGDVSLLQWAEVDLAAMMIRRERQKTGNMATIPIMAGSELHECLKEKEKIKLNSYPNDAAKGLWYVDPDLALLYRRSRIDGAIAARFARITNKAGIDSHKTFHNFRATLCSKLANGDVPTPLACAITGHKNANVFKEYVTPDEQALKESLHRAVTRVG